MLDLPFLLFVNVSEANAIPFLYSLPGVFFFYEVSPLHVEISEVYRRGWVAFLTSLCAIIGGVVTVAGFLDQYLFQHNKEKTGGLAR